MTSGMHRRPFEGRHLVHYNSEGYFSEITKNIFLWHNLILLNTLISGMTSSAFSVMTSGAFSGMTSGAFSGMTLGAFSCMTSGAFSCMTSGAFSCMTSGAFSCMTSGAFSGMTSDSFSAMTSGKVFLHRKGFSHLTSPKPLVHNNSHSECIFISNNGIYFLYIFYTVWGLFFQQNKKKLIFWPFWTPELRRPI